MEPAKPYSETVAQELYDSLDGRCRKIKISYFVFPNGKELLTIGAAYGVRAWQRFEKGWWEPVDIVEGMFGYTSSVQIEKVEQVMI